MHLSFRYTTGGGINPCFGELALMYGKPRVAIDLASLIGESGFDEATSRFYTAGVRHLSCT